MNTWCVQKNNIYNILIEHKSIFKTKWFIYFYSKRKCSKEKVSKYFLQYLNWQLSQRERIPSETVLVSSLQETCKEACTETSKEATNL